MSRQTFRLTIDLHDPGALFDAAEEICLRECQDWEVPDILGTREAPDVGACLSELMCAGADRALIDCGFEIVNSGVEQ